MTTASPANTLRPSRLLAKMKAGRIARSTKLNTTDATVTEIAGLAGFDAAWLCQEHCPNSLNDIQHCVRAAAMADMDVIVRVPRGSYSDLIRPLELGASAIMIPHVITPAEAKEIAWQTKFHPVGRRALDSGNADGGYCSVPLKTYMQHANEQTLVIVQIEDPEALEHLDAIAATPGIDMLLFGPGDYSQGIGDPGNFDHPEIDKARRAVVAACKKHGKWAGTVGSVANFQHLAQLGYNYINLGGEVVILYQAFRKLLEETASTAGAPAADADDARKSL
jgi:4-hydroxy-2-oxoheptanedioate aldolase